MERRSSNYLANICKIILSPLAPTNAIYLYSKWVWNKLSIWDTQNKAKIFPNIISTECPDKWPHQRIISPLPVHLLMPHRGQGLHGCRCAKKLERFTSTMCQTDNISFRVNPRGHCFPLRSAAFLLCPLEIPSAGWFYIHNVVRNSSVVLKSIPWLLLLTTGCFSPLGSFRAC